MRCLRTGCNVRIDVSYARFCKQCAGCKRRFGRWQEWLWWSVEAVIVGRLSIMRLESVFSVIELLTLWSRSSRGGNNGSEIIQPMATVWTNHWLVAGRSEALAKQDFAIDPGRRGKPNREQDGRKAGDVKVSFCEWSYHSLSWQRMRANEKEYLRPSR